MEVRLNELAKTNDVVRKIQDLKYSFTKGYELDLKALNVPTEAHEPTISYAERLSKANVTEIIAAVFILWGPLLIGGGAFLKPKIERSFGKNACNVFEDVVGKSRGGRAGRRKEFIELWDSLYVDSEEKQKQIVEHCAEFMDLNNKIMRSVKRRPWWAIPVLLTSTTLVALGVAYFYYNSKSSSKLRRRG